MFRIAGIISSRNSLIIEISGFILILIVWFLITYPKKHIILTFKSEQLKTPQYIWTGSNNFKANFNGDNIIENVQPGTYKFSVSDSAVSNFTGEIIIPAKLDTDIVKDYAITSNSNNAKIIIEVKVMEDGLVSKAILPTPQSVLLSYKDLHFKDFVVRETAYSFSINALGYIEAAMVSILLGFLIGLIPFMRSLLNRWVNAIRFIPLTAVTGLFIAWFGIATNMKVQFLAFGIFVYLLPVVVQRIDEVSKVYLQTAYTLGASSWQQIRHVYWPHVVSRLIDDIRVLTAISWTYIIIAEMLNQTGGVGALIHLAGRQSRLDKVFALLIIIVFIGVLQDKFFAWLNKVLFPYKKNI